MHVGLNLIFLVPGETGGMEVAARETIPALVAAAPAGTRFTAFVNRDAGPGPWGELIPKVEVPVRVANRLEWVRVDCESVITRSERRTASGTRIRMPSARTPAWASG